MYFISLRSFNSRYFHTWNFFNEILFINLSVIQLVIIFALIASVLSENDVIEDNSSENFFDDTFFVFGQKTNYKRENPIHVNPTYEGRRNYISPDYKPLHQNEPRLYYNSKNENSKYSEQVHSKPSVESYKDSTYAKPENDEPAEPAQVKEDTAYQKVSKYFFKR